MSTAFSLPHANDVYSMIPLGHHIYLTDLLSRVVEMRVVRGKVLVNPIGKVFTWRRGGEIEENNRNLHRFHAP